MTCPLPDNPALRSSMRFFLPTAVKASLVVWMTGVLYVFSALAYPHKAYLFHLHTVSATFLIVLLGSSVLSSLQASSTTASPSPSTRRAFLNWHRSGMLLSIVLTIVVSSLMILKKSYFGDKPLLLLSRSTSWHSLLALVWMCLVVPALSLSGMVIHPTEPPSCISSLAKRMYGSVGEAKKQLRALHRQSGFLAWTVAMLVAVCGLSEKNDDATKHSLAYVLVGIWCLMLAQKMIK